MSRPFIEIKNLMKVYQMGGEKIFALNDVSLDIEKGEVVCLLGTSGSGKSTLLNAIAGLEKPSSGSVWIGNIPIHKLTEDEVTTFRRKNIGFIFQSYNLIPTQTALENVTLGLIFKGTPKKEREEKGKEILNAVGLGSRFDHKPNELSGGQQQRVSIARAFVDSPKIIFADEPTGNLDSKTTVETLELMTNMVKKNKQTMIIVSHDTEVTDYSDVVHRMHDGKIRTTERLLDRNMAKNL